MTQQIADADLINYGGSLGALGAIPRGKELAARSDYRSAASMLDLSAPGTLVSKDDPSQLYNFGWWDDDPTSDFSTTMFLEMRKKGYHVATKDSFIVAPDLREVISPDDSGRLTLMGNRGGRSAKVVVYQSKADYDRSQKDLLRDSDELQKSFEERSAEQAEKLAKSGLGKLGARSTSTVEDEYMQVTDTKKRK